MQGLGFRVGLRVYVGPLSGRGSIGLSADI